MATEKTHDNPGRHPLTDARYHKNSFPLLQCRNCQLVKSAKALTQGSLVVGVFE
jgi:hypothetical protein